jgi:hypothetical protein
MEKQDTSNVWPRLTQIVWGMWDEGMAFYEYRSFFILFVLIAVRIPRSVSLQHSNKHCVVCEQRAVV